MTKTKTSELTGPALRYAVAVAEGWKFGDWHQNDGDWQVWAEKLDDEGRGPAGYFPADTRLHFDTEWAQAGPIIEREGIDLRKRVPDPDIARPHPRFAWKAELVATNPYFCGTGPTPLIAAMRCYGILANRR